MASQEELDAMAKYLRENRRDKGMRAARSTSAYGAVASGRETAADAFDRRELYPEVKTAAEKAQEAAPIIESMGGLESNLYGTALGSLDRRYAADVSAYMQQQQVNARIREASAKMRLAGLQQAALQLERQVQRAEDMSDSGLTFLRKYSTTSSIGAGSAGGLSGVESLMAASQSTAAGAQPSAQMQADAKALVVSEMGRVQGSWAAGQQLDPAELLRTVNTIVNVSGVAGIDVDEVLREYNQNLVDSGARVNEAGVPEGGLDPDVFVDMLGDANKETQQIHEGLGSSIDQLQRQGVGGITELDEVSAMLGGTAQDIYGAYDPTKQLLPGTEIVPETDALSRYVQVLDTIDAQPEHPPVVDARNHILQSEAYLAYKKERGYEGMDDAQVFREYKRELKGELKGRKQDFRAQRRQNIEQGLSKPAFGEKPPEKPKPEVPNAAAGIAGGSDSG